jgi:hypothetical protein
LQSSFPVSFKLAVTRPRSIGAHLLIPGVVAQICLGEFGPSGLCDTIQVDRLFTAGILVTWSPPEDRLHDLAHLFLLQSYPVILSTYLSLGRQQLSSTDLVFTIFFTIYSPMGVYFFVSNIRDLWRNWRHVFTRPQISRLPRRVLILLMPPIVIILGAVAGSPHALTDSQCNSTDADTYNYTKAERIASIPGLYAPFVFVLFYLVYITRHLKDILVEARRRANSHIWVRQRTWLRRFQFAMRYPFAWINASWYVSFVCLIASSTCPDQFPG